MARPPSQHPKFFGERTDSLKNIPTDGSITAADKSVVYEETGCVVNVRSSKAGRVLSVNGPVSQLQNAQRRSRYLCNEHRFAWLARGQVADENVEFDDQLVSARRKEEGKARQEWVTKKLKHLPQEWEGRSRASKRKRWEEDEWQLWREQWTDEEWEDFGWVVNRVGNEKWSRVPDAGVWADSPQSVPGAPAHQSRGDSQRMNPGSGSSHGRADAPRPMEKRQRWADYGSESDNEAPVDDPWNNEAPVDGPWKSRLRSQSPVRKPERGVKLVSAQDVAPHTWLDVILERIKLIEDGVQDFPTRFTKGLLYLFVVGNKNMPGMPFNHTEVHKDDLCRCLDKALRTCKRVTVDCLDVQHLQHVRRSDHIGSYKSCLEGMINSQSQRVILRKKLTLVVRFLQQTRVDEDADFLFFCSHGKHRSIAVMWWVLAVLKATQCRHTMNLLSRFAWSRTSCGKDGHHYCDQCNMYEGKGELTKQALKLFVEVAESMTLVTA